MGKTNLMSRFKPFALDFKLRLIAVGLIGLPALRAASPPASGSSDAVIELNPITVTASKDDTLFERFEQFQWHADQFAQGDRFHIRNGQLVDAIIFCHDYLQQHPLERASVIVVTEPKYHRVTQAAAAYTVGKTLRVASSALGDIAAGGLTAADIDSPEKIRSYIQGIRRAYLKAVVAQGPVTLGMIMAAV